MDMGANFIVEVDSINRLLGVLFDNFPTQIFDNKKHTLHVANVIEKTSTDLCTLISKGIVKMDSSKRMGGSFGIVGPLYIRTDVGNLRLYAHDVSFDSYRRDKCRSRRDQKGRKVREGHNCNWTEYELELLVKRAKRPQLIYLKTYPHPTISHISIYEANETLCEAIVGGLASYLYELGVAPCVAKTFGYYICPTRGRSYKTNLLIERSSIPLNHIFGCYHSSTAAKKDWPNSIAKKILSSINTNDLIIWSCHIARTLFVLKHHFGIVHFDCHQSNILLSIVTDNEELTDEKIDLVYGGENLTDVNLFDYSLPNGKRLILENNGYVPKLIDYGLSMADFASSVENKAITVQICSNDGLNKVPGLKMAMPDRNGYGDVDFNFFMYNMVYHLFEASTNSCKNAFTPEERAKFKVMYAEFLQFVKAVVPGFSFDKKIVIDWGNKEIAYSLNDAIMDSNESMFHARNVGTTDDIASPLNLIYTYLREKGYTNDRGVYVTSNGSLPVEDTLTLMIGHRSSCGSSRSKDYSGCPKESAHINVIKQILKQCGDGVPLTKKSRRRCLKLIDRKKAVNPKNYVPLPIVIDNKGVVLQDPSTGELKEQITYKDLRPFLIVNGSPIVTLYKIPYISHLTSEATSIYVMFLASNRFTSKIETVESSQRGYEKTAALRKTSVTILAHTDISQSHDEDLAVVHTKGKTIGMRSYKRDREYDEDTNILVAPTAIKLGVGVPAQHDMANDQMPRSILGITESGITVLLMSEGGDLNTVGIVADELTIIALKIGVHVGVHLSHGWGTNAILSINAREPMWVMPSNMYIYQKSPLALSFTAK